MPDCTLLFFLGSHIVCPGHEQATWAAVLHSVLTFYSLNTGDLLLSAALPSEVSGGSLGCWCAGRHLWQAATAG